MSAISEAAKKHRKAYQKAWRAANPRDRRAYKKSYDASHRAENLAYCEANKDRLKSNKAAYYSANRARILARVQSYTAANHERVLEYHRKFHAANPTKTRAWSAAWRKRNPERKAHLENRRRARQAGNGGSHTLTERREKFQRLGNVCFYCQAQKPLTVDHDVPLARGGTDDIENILPACRRCNSSKNTKTAQEFMATNHQRTGGVKSGDEGR